MKKVNTKKNNPKEYKIENSPQSENKRNEINEVTQVNEINEVNEFNEITKVNTAVESNIEKSQSTFDLNDDFDIFSQPLELENTKVNTINDVVSSVDSNIDSNIVSNIQPDVNTNEYLDDNDIINETDKNNNMAKSNEIATSSMKLDEDEAIEDLYDENEHDYNYDYDDNYEEANLDDLDELDDSMDEEDGNKLSKGLIAVILSIAVICVVSYFLYNFLIKDLQVISSADKLVSSENYNEAITLYDSILEKGQNSSVQSKKDVALDLLAQKKLISKDINSITPEDYKTLIDLSQNSKLYKEESILIINKIESELVNAAQKKLDTNNISGAMDTIKPFMDVNANSKSLGDIFNRISEKQNSLKTITSAKTSDSTANANTSTSDSNEKTVILKSTSNLAKVIQISLNDFYDLYLNNVVSSINTKNTDSIEKFMDSKSTAYEDKISYIKEEINSNKEYKQAGKQILDIVVSQDGSYELLVIESMTNVKNGETITSYSTVKYKIYKTESPYGFIIKEMRVIS